MGAACIPTPSFFSHPHGCPGRVRQGVEAHGEAITIHTTARWTTTPIAVALCLHLRYCHAVPPWDPTLVARLHTKQFLVASRRLPSTLGLTTGGAHGV